MIRRLRRSCYLCLSGLVISTAALGLAGVGCQLDHIRAFSVVTRGGKTIRVNLGPLCEQHHNAKTHGGWTLTYDPTTRTKSWTSPLGRTYAKDAAPLRT